MIILPPAPPSVPQGLPPMPPGMMPPPPSMHISPAGMAMGIIPHSGIGLPPMPPMQHIPRPPPPPMGMVGGQHMFPPPPPPPMSRPKIATTGQMRSSEWPRDGSSSPVPEDPRVAKDGIIPHSGIGLPPMPPMQHIPRPPPPPMGMVGGQHQPQKF
uniref:Uncharacterized protein n=1 Tax=Meloidogyne floridensis TaxID=298350 RepID=A0A915NWA4_9BILA